MKSYKISSYNKFINESNEDIHSICKKYKIETHIDNNEVLISDEDGGVTVREKYK